MHCDLLLWQVVRVDPQIMLVLNTDAMRFEDQRGGQHHCEASQVRRRRVVRGGSVVVGT